MTGGAAMNTRYISEADRSFIENKYHRQDQPFDPYNRFGYHGYEFLPETGLDDTQMLRGLRALYDTMADEPHALIKAEGFAYVLDHMRIDVNESDYFVGLYNWGRLLDKAFIGRWKSEAFREADKDNLVEDYEQSGTASIWLDTEHYVPDWDVITSLGISGLLDRIRAERTRHTSLSPEKAAFFRAMEVEYTAILRLLDRLIDFSASHPNRKTELVLPALKNIRSGPPKTTLDALELMYLFFMLSEYVEQFQTRSIGNGLDHTLLRFYQHDLCSRSFTREQLKSFLAYFLLQFTAIGHPQGHPFYLGGMDENGEDTSNDLTYDILEVYESLNIFNPKVQLKINEKTPDALIDRVLRMIRSGKNSFVFVCQPGMIRSMMDCYGVSRDEARTADISGCNEMHVKGDEACMIAALPNAAKAVTYVIHNGYDTVSQKQLGLKTGEFACMQCFDEFYGAFIRQLSYIIDRCVTFSNSIDHQVAGINPSVLLSATSGRALANAQDVYAFGAKYVTSALLLCSFATAVDSVMAVKKLVYDDKTVSAAQLKRALDANWHGYEELRQQAKHLCQKYGNGDREADACAAKLFRWFNEYITGRPNGRGGVYKAGVPSTMEFITQGLKTEATPDGRRAGEECSRNVQPVNGAEHCGVTGYLRSVLHLEPKYFSEAFVADVMLHPSAVSGDDGIAALRGLIKAYMRNGGISIQFNIFSLEMLYDAQKHPENYSDLQVRITGWNALWNDLSPKEQAAYIERASSIAALC